MQTLELRTFIFWMVVLLALALRLWGINFGLIHADEPIIVNHAMAYGAGDMNPHFFKIPPLVSYGVFGLYAAFFGALMAIGHIKSAPDFAALFFSSPEMFYLIARVVFGAMMGTVTVAWVYLEARRLFSDRAAILGALFLAVNYLHVRDSHYIYADIPMVLAICLVFSAARRVYSFGGAKHYAVAGAMIGLAAAIKYNAALISFAVFMAHCLRNKRSHIYLLMAAAVSVVVFISLNPFILADPSFFWMEMRTQAAAEGSVGFSHVLGYSLWHGAGSGLLMLAVFGACIYLRQQIRVAVMFLSFPSLYLLTLILFSQPHERYVLPLIPFICLLGGLGADRLLALPYTRLTRYTLFLVVLISLIVPSYKCVKVSRLLARPDTRQMTKQWIEANVTAGSKIAFDHSGFRPRLERTRRQWEQQLSRQDITAPVRQKMEFESAASKEPAYDLFFLSDLDALVFSSVWPILPFSVDGLSGQGIRYVVLHSEPNDPDVQFKEAIKKIADLKMVISPFIDTAQQVPSDPFAVTCAPFTWKDLVERKHLGPYLEIYELKG